MRTAVTILFIGLAAACSESSNPGVDTIVDTIVDTTEVDTTTDSIDALDTTETIDAPDATDPGSEDGPRDTIGMLCATDEECQNGLYCDGEEICPYGFCQAGARVTCDDGIDCTIDTCVEETDSCDNTVSTEACDDSNPCTDDTCDVETDTCIFTPIDCSDSVNCTLDTCDTTTGDCEHTISDLACDDSDACTIDTCDVSSDTCINTLIDGDGDLHAPDSCGGDDCDDTDDTIYTGAPEVCGDGIDQDCDGSDAPEGGCDCPVSLSVPSTVRGDTTGMTAAYDGSCAYSTGGREVVHRLDLTGPSDVRFMIVDSWFDGVLYVREGSCTGTELDCIDFWSGALDLSLTAGSYYVFVDGQSTYDYGTYELSVATYVPPTPVTGNDDCPSAFALTADGTFGGSNVSSGNNDDPTYCAYTSSGNDVWFTFTLTSSASLTFATFGSDYDTVLYVLDGSCTGTEVECDDDGGVSLDSRIAASFSAGTYYLALDAYDSYEYGDWVLSVTGLP